MFVVIKAVVRDRRLIVEEEVDLPDGTEVRLVIDEDDDGQTVDPETAERVRAAFDAIGEQPALSAREVLRELRELGGKRSAF